MHLGLRAKAALALCACIALVVVLSLAAGLRILRGVEENLGVAFARNTTQYNKQRILAPVMRELALSQRLADSEVTRRWLLDENNAAGKALFFAEAERYRGAFTDHSYFVISAATRGYYFNDSRGKWSNRPRYFLEPGAPQDAWFFNTMKHTRDFNINVDPDVVLKVTKVWFNVMVRENNHNIGIAGTGLDLTTFLNRFISSRETGVTPMILNREGAIQAHPSRGLIDYASVNDKGDEHSTIFRLLGSTHDRDTVRDALQRAQRDAEDVHIFRARMNGRNELFAVSFIPELGWHVVTAVDLQAAQVTEQRLWLPLSLAAGLLLVLLIVAIILTVDRVLLLPLLKLTRAVRGMASGDYTVELPAAGNDEVGELTRAFDAMATRVRTHTDDLEATVRARTRELVATNEQMAAANQKIGDSIQYASLIQNAILPDAQLRSTLGDDYFVLWRPRDVVGGDFYVCHATDKGCLLGVVDCAGHGVPGALMTMVAHSAIKVAIDTFGAADPARLLGQLDTQVRAMLQHDVRHAQVASQMEAGFVFIDCDKQNITFSGAKISLYWCDGGPAGELRGDRAAIGGKREAVFNNQSLPLDAGATYYLTTDGLLDQCGGPRGFSFGRARFAELLQRCAAKTPAEQEQIFVRELAAYQGELAQRDDITVLGLRLAQVEMSLNE